MTEETNNKGMQQAKGGVLAQSDIELLRKSLEFYIKNSNDLSSLEESKASTEEATAEVNLEEVLDETQETTPEIANTNEASSGEAETLKSKFQSAFSKENIKITY